MKEQGSNRPGHQGGHMEHTYAAIDLGTNNCRLLVARPAAEGFRVVDAFSRIVRLGEGVDGSLRLSEEAMKRTIAALKVCADKMRRRKVTRARCVATAACRRAENCDEFLKRVNQEAGLFIETISAEEEANLAVAACRPLLAEEARFALVFDIGGGSTELIWARHDAEAGIKPIAMTSLPHGVVSIAERHGSGDFSPAEFEALVQQIGGQLCAFETANDINRHIRQGGVQMIGTSGTVTTLSGVHLGLQKYDRQRVDGLWLSFADAGAAAEKLRNMKLEQRAAHPCIGRGRADLVVAGCAILEAIRRT
ncbi:MAG: Ppx/GppA family phosphatase, partial [Rhodospirillaceae bacterium]|nr:Ppx/GppA family phosphatase [Rhodospirillaceae bacterium]